MVGHDRFKASAGFDRRNFLIRTFGTLAGLGILPAAAQQQGSLVGGQAEWAQSYDVGAQKSRTIETATPILSSATLQATEGAIRVYQELVARGGHPPLPADQRLKLGTRHPNV
ncbi:MAG: murein L,D-transpeptidase, partial [Rhabdaerophilum calidifontis]